MSIDINNVLHKFKMVLRKQNEKGIKEYGVPLKDSTLDTETLFDYLEEEIIDVWQYLQVIRNRKDVDNAKYHLIKIFINEEIKRLSDQRDNAIDEIVKDDAKRNLLVYYHIKKQMNKIERVEY